jgi:hypothetical protein
MLLSRFATAITLAFLGLALTQTPLTVSQAIGGEHSAEGRAAPDTPPANCRVTLSSKGSFVAPSPVPARPSGVVRQADRRLFSVFRARFTFSRISVAGGPDEGLGAFIVAVDVGADGHDQLFQIAKNAAPQSVLGEIREEALHHVQPRRIGGREVHRETRVPREPALDFGVLMGSVVVADQVEFEMRGHTLIEQHSRGTRQLRENL